VDLGRKEKRELPAEEKGKDTCRRSPEKGHSYRTVVENGIQGVGTKRKKGGGNERKSTGWFGVRLKEGGERGLYRGEETMCSQRGQKKKQNTESGKNNEYATERVV